MAKDERENIIVGLDIGTTKVCAIVGKQVNGSVDIQGIGLSPSYGLRKGVVVNIDNTVESIKKAVEDASRMAGVEINSVFAGIGGGHIKSLNSHGVIAVSRSDREITQEDVDRVVDAAKAISVPLDREVIHVIPQEFIIDNQDGIREPVGMSGVRLEVEVHIVTAAVTSAQNIYKSVQRAGVYVEDIVLQPLAASEAILNRDEKELGVAMVDIGGGTTDIVIFCEGGVRHTSVLAIGGNQVTTDIAIGLRTPNAEAEDLKKKYGCAMVDLAAEGEEIKVPGVGGRPDKSVPRRALAEIIQPRIEEIFTLVGQEIRANGYEDNIASGLAVTGGTALLPGIADVAEKILELPVRIGKPQGISGLVDVVNSPLYAAGVGLVLYGAKSRSAGVGIVEPGSGAFGKIKDWFKEFF